MTATTNYLIAVLGSIALYLFYSVIIRKPKPVTGNLNYLNPIDDEFVSLSISIRNSKSIKQLQACRTRMVHFYRRHGEKVNPEIERLLDIYDEQEQLISKTIKH